MTLTEYSDDADNGNGQGDDDEDDGKRVQVTGEIVDHLTEHFANFPILVPKLDIA